jgi:hypothetical protein
MTPPNKEAAQSERERFEAWAIPRCLHMPRRPDDEYASVTTQEAWEAWEARAALATPVAEQPSKQDKFCDANCTWRDHAPGCERAESVAAPAQAIPDVLFDGHAVYQALDDQAKKRITPIGVSDVLDAVARLLRAAPPSPQAPAAQPMTDDDIRDAWLKSTGSIDIPPFCWDEIRGFARAIEARRK